MSFGGNKSKSRYSSSYGQTAWQPSANFYSRQAQSLPVEQFGRGYQNLQNIAGNVTDDIGNVADTAYGGYRSQLGGGQTGQVSQSINPNLLNSLSNSLLQPSNQQSVYNEIQFGGNPFVNNRITALNNRLADNLNRYTLPGIDNNASAAGQAGGSRHGIAEGLARADAFDSMAELNADILGKEYYDNLDRRLAIARDADANRLALQQSLLNLNTAADQNTRLGLDYLPQYQQAHMARLSPWAFTSQLPYQTAQYIQNPTVLSSGSSRGKGKSGGFGVNFGIQG